MVNKTKPTTGKGGAVGALKTTATQRRAALKYGVNTTSLTAKGVIPITGATKYPPQPSIYFTHEAWVKQCHLIDKSPLEVGWFALVDHDEADNSFTITELVIPCQEVTAAETDIGKEDLADAAMELIEAGKDTGKMYAWFHSHVNMGVSPSGQDEHQVEEFLEDLADQPEVPAFIRGIQNKRGDLKLDVYYIQHGIAYQNLDVNVLHEEDPKWRTDIDAEIKTKVTARTYTAARQFPGQGGARTSTGKNQLPSERNPNVHQNGRGYNWGDYGLNEWDGYYTGYETKDVGGKEDNFDLPEASTLTYQDTLFMDVVFSSGDNRDVLSDDEGNLWVCDEVGDVYAYAAYTEAFGELDDKVASKVAYSGY